MNLAAENNSETAKEGYLLEDEYGRITTTSETESAYGNTWKSILLHRPPPDALPDGWILHRSRSQPGYVYYWNQYTGECAWEPPFSVTGGLTALSGIVAETLHSLQQQQLLQEMQQEQQQQQQQDMQMGMGIDSSSSSRSILKKNPVDSSTVNLVSVDSKVQQESSSDIRLPEPKKPKLDSTASTSATTTTTASPEQVHVLHILKKHKDSRRPSSWRVPKITITKEKAREELQELLSILHESLNPATSEKEEDLSELRATFEELAKTESDCSSAKKGGDLGWFGRKKMQPAFEEASFSLQVGELSDIVDTSSGLHILLRLG